MAENIKNYQKRIKELSDIDLEITFDNLDYESRRYNNELDSRIDEQVKLERRVNWLNKKIEELQDKKKVVGIIIRNRTKVD